MELKLSTTATATKTSLKQRIRPASNFIELIPACLIRQTSAIFFSEFNSEGLYQSLGKEKGSFRPVSPFSTKT